MLRPFLDKLVARTDLETAEAAAAMRLLMSGEAAEAQVGALLIAWRMKGETGAEILGCARVLRERAERFEPVPDDAVDTCGTGGDARGTFNISTLAAFVAAAAGVPVAKHGNRSVSSRCGSADLLEGLGVPPDPGRAALHRCLRRTGYAFLFAPAFHLAMQNVAAIRRTLGTRTLFNLLGPLLNPARVTRQVVGVFHPDYLEPMARALAGLGARHALVVHSRDGLDEISVCAETDVVEVGPDGKPVRRYQLGPEKLGLRRRKTGSLRGGEIDRNLEIAAAVLAGKAGAHRDAVAANAGAAIYLGGRAATLREGVEMAAAILGSGAAREKLEQIRVAVGPVPAAGSGAGGETRIRGRPAPGGLLESIVARRRERLREAEKLVPLEEIRLRAGSAPAPRGFRDRLEQEPGVAVIAEIKRASPSAGVFKRGLLPASLAELYQFAGARAISVLTEEDHFLGRPGDLTEVRERIDLPLLRKDFILEPYQVYESRALGADALLLIAGILDRKRLERLLRVTREVGMDALVEVHDESELDDALEAGARLVGINNRNLRDFRVDLGVGLRLAGRIPESVTPVAESGIRTREEIATLRDAGYRAFLIGETLVRSDDPVRTLRELLS